MKKVPFIIFAVILAAFLVSCSGMAGTDSLESTREPDMTTNKIVTEIVTTDKITTELITTEAVTTEETTTAPPETTAPPVTPVTPPPSKDPITVSYPVSKFGATFTGLPSLPEVEYLVNDPYNTRGLSSAKHAFSYGVASGGYPHSITVNNQATFDSYGRNALAWDNKSGGKVLYLTFDCGYKYGDLTARILDTLKEKEVPAAFFCTMTYLESEPAEIARMINEGHTVGNHTVKHPDCTTVSRQRMAEELLGVHNYLRVNFGYTPTYFRFPEGAYSESTLELCQSLGYRSVFWSLAYADWDPENQQGVEVAFEQVTSRLHPGAVILLHSTSPDNAAILGRVIDYARAQGYEFRSLDEYNYWK